MLLEHPGLDPFEPELRRIAELAFTGGLKALAEQGLSPGDLERDASAHQIFIRGCHAGFDRAQADIVKLIVSLEEHLRAVQKGRPANRNEQLAILRVLKARQLTLRRLVDAILFQVLYPEHRAVRYFPTQDRMQPIDPRVLQKTAETAARLNGEDPMTFHLLADLTSVAQVGDLVCVDRSDPTSIGVAVIELKEGRVNELLFERMRDKPGPLSEEDLAEIARTINPDAAKQARRMERQKERALNFAAILADDKGHSALLDRPVSVEAKRHYVGDYFEAIGRVWQRAKEQQYGVETVDRCLHLIAIKSEEGKPHGRLGFAAHTAYHLVNEDAECLLPDDAKRPSELERVAEMGPGLINLAHNSLTDKMGHSPFLIGHPELVMDLLFERVFVYLYFDYAKFFAVAAEHGLTLEWVTDRPPQSKTVVRNPILGSPQAYGVRLTRNGITDSVMILEGFFRHAISDFTPPNDLVKVLLDRELRPSTDERTTPSSE